MTGFVGILVSALIAWFLYALVIWIVGKIGLGINVTGFVPALIAAAVIVIIAAIINWLLGLFGLSLGAPGLITAIIAFIVAALVLMFADRFVSGYSVNGFIGALIGAAAIGVVGWLVNWVLSLF